MRHRRSQEVLLVRFFVPGAATIRVWRGSPHSFLRYLTSRPPEQGPHSHKRPTGARSLAAHEALIPPKTKTLFFSLRVLTLRYSFIFHRTSSASSFASSTPSPPPPFVRFLLRRVRRR